MNENEKKYNSIKMLYLAFGKETTQQRIMLYVEFLKDYTSSQVEHAVSVAINNENFLPTVAKLRQMLSPDEDERDLAVEISGEIINQIRKCGYYREEEARRVLSDVAWVAVERFGGWKELCMSDNLNMLRAQLRDCCKSAMTTSLRNKTNENNKKISMNKTLKKLTYS